MKSNWLKIDAIAHVTPAKFLEALRKISPEDVERRILHTPPLYDLDARFRIMDKYQVMQVITLGPVISEIADPDKTVELSRLANDGMAELVLKYPDRFVAAIASVPMNNIDAALVEVDRAIKVLKFRGILINSNEYGKPLSSPDFIPIFDKMSKYNLPIFIHPQRGTNTPDYESPYAIPSIFGWPYETTLAMTHLIFGGVLEKYPNLKIITHHGGGMVPYYEQRIVQHYAKHEISIRSSEFMQSLTQPPIDYYKKFYCDTAIHGNVPALMCAHNFFGADRVMFGADMPLGDRFFGFRSYLQTITAIEQMDISDEDRQKIFADNARKVFRLLI
jgi:predicted TIM-barrel fold metal-dependent hydrolase